MLKIILPLLALILTTSSASAAPYTFNQEDYLEYVIIFGKDGRSSTKASKLLNIIVGDVDSYFSGIGARRPFPARLQVLSLKTDRGSVEVNRQDNIGLTAIRETWPKPQSPGTKLLDVRFEKATCTDANGATSPCTANLLLTTDAPDEKRGLVRQARTLVITTSTGLSFRYRSAPHDLTKPFNRSRRERSPVIINYAFEKRVGN
jgi:hypothetical protein